VVFLATDAGIGSVELNAVAVTVVADTVVDVVAGIKKNTGR